MFSAMGETLTEDEAREVLSEFDEGSKGGLNYEEFVQLTQSKAH